MTNDLTELAKDHIGTYQTHRLEYVLETLNEADELDSGLTWESTVWEGCTVEELLGALLEAENMLERERDADE